MKIGFIGLGKMGLPMVKNLLQKEFAMVVLSRSRPPIEEALQQGATEALSPALLAQEVDVVCTCLPFPEDVNNIYLGDNGVHQGGKPGQLWIDFSTIGPALCKSVANAAQNLGAFFLDAPVSGGPQGAKDATLAIMVGGNPDAFTRAKPIFDALGKHTAYMGKTGSGSITKLINNMLVAVHQMAFLESLLLAQHYALKFDQLLDVLKASTGYSKAMDNLYPRVCERNFDARFSIDLLHKDVRLALEALQQAGLPQKGFKEAFALLDESRRKGFGSLDTMAMLLALEEEAHTTLTCHIQG